MVSMTKRFSLAKVKKKKKNHTAEPDLAELFVNYFRILLYTVQ